MAEAQDKQQQKPVGKRRRALRIVLRLAAGFISLAVLAFMIAQVALWAGVFWLQSAPGQQWMTQTLAQLSSESGVRISAEGVSGPNLRGFGVSHLRVSDAAGDFLTADDVKISLDVSRLPSRALSLSLGASKIELLRLPAMRDDAASASQEVVLPDLYFSAVRLSSIDIKKLVIAPAVAGNTIETGVTGNASVTLQRDGLAAKLLLALTQEKDPLLPRKLEGKAHLALPEGKVTLSHFKASGAQYELNAKGQYGINDGAIETHATLKTGAMPQLGGGSLDLAADVTGTAEIPLVSAKGLLSLSKMVAPGLDDITFTLSSDKTLKGHAQAETKWRDLPARLVTDYSFAGGVLTLADIKGEAPDIAVKGALTLDTATKLAAGKIVAHFDLARYHEITGHDIGGKGSAEIVLSSRDGKQASDIEMSLSSARYERYVATGVTVLAEYKDLSDFWPARSQLALKEASVGDILLPRLAAVITPAQGGQFYLETDGQALLPQPISFKATAMLGGATIDTAYVRDIDFVISPRKGSIRVTGAASIEKLDLAFQSKNAPIDALPVAVPDALAAVAVSGKIGMKGTAAAPRIDAALDFTPVALRRDVPALVTHADAILAAGKLDIKVAGKGRGVRQLRADIGMPLALSLYPFRISDIRTAPLMAAIEADMELKPLTGALLPADIVLNGNATVKAQAQGTLASPQMAGDAVLSKGYLRYEAAGFALKGIELRAAVTNDTLQLKSFSARDEKNGTVSASGTVGYVSRSLPVDLNIKAQNIGHFVNQDTFNGDLSGDLSLKGERNSYEMTGTVKAGEVNITIPDRFDSDIPQLNVVRQKTRGKRAPNFLQSVALHIDFSAPNRVFVRGWGLDAEFGGAVGITGTLKEPLFDGAMESKRGRYEEFGRVFTFDHAYLRFQGAVPPSPFLDIQAVTKINDVSAQVNLTGPVKEPAIALSAVPAMPQDEVMSHILFGKDMSKISPFQAVQLASSLRRLTGQGGSGFEPLGAIRKATGLENLQVETDENGGTTVGAGKYITDKVYLEAEKGSGEKSGAAAVKIDITPHLKAESKIGQDNKSGGSLNWEWDY